VRGRDTEPRLCARPELGGRPGNPRLSNLESCVSGISAPSNIPRRTGIVSLKVTHSLGPILNIGVNIRVVGVRGEPVPSPVPGRLR